MPGGLALSETFISSTGTFVNRNAADEVHLALSGCICCAAAPMRRG